MLGTKPKRILKAYVVPTVLVCTKKVEQRPTSTMRIKTKEDKEVCVQHACVCVCISACVLCM